MSKKKKNQNDLDDLENEIEKDIEKVEGPSFDFEIKEDNKKNKKIFIIIIAVLLIIVLASCFIFFYILKPTIKINGNKEINLMINSEYVDQKAEAKYLKKDVSSDIKINGEVNTKKKGRYTITYSIKKCFQTKSVKRIVNVVENGPIIDLEGGKDYSICPDSKFEEVGFKAFDNEANDLTDKVVTSNGQDTVTYTVKDSNNTIFTITRNLVREDKEAPELKLNGNNHVYVTLGAKYNEQGATAIDKCDGDITDKIEITGSVDTNTLGDYELTYKVIDKVGNTSNIKRTVTVQKEVVKRSANLSCGKPGVIYLTFDDGPNSTNTPKVLEVLKKYNVKATFFVTGNGTDELIKREYNEGHLVALHTYTHSYPKVYASIDAYYNDLELINNKVEKLTGKKSKYVRFPGGSSNTVSKSQGHSPGLMSNLVNDVEAKGYSYFDWNVDSRDAETATNCYQVSNNAINGLSKSHGNVILMHDIHAKTAGDCGGKSAVEKIIEYGLNNGYTFDVLDSTIVCHHKVNN